MLESPMRAPQVKNRLHVATVFLAVLCTNSCQPHSDPIPSSTAKPLTVTEVTIGNGVTANATVQPLLVSLAPLILQIRTEGSTDGAVLEAKLTNLKSGHSLDPVESRIVTKGPTLTKLTFNNPLGWTAGRYLGEIKLNGKLVYQQDFDVFESTATQ